MGRYRSKRAQSKTKQICTKTLSCRTLYVPYKQTLCTGTAQSDYLIKCALSMEKDQTVTTPNGLIIPTIKNINFAAIPGIAGRRGLFNFNACDRPQNCQMQDILRALSLTIGSSMSNYPHLEALLRHLYKLPGAGSQVRAPMSWHDLMAKWVASFTNTVRRINLATWKKGIVNIYY